MSIETIPIRATISFTGGVSISTPYIMSFSVNKSRGAISTFNASIKIKSDQLDNLNGKVTIKAGKKGNLITIYTGYVKSMAPSPCWDDPAYVIVNISGVDELFKLENRRFTRRQIVSDKSWAVINSVVSEGSKPTELKYTHTGPVIISSPDDDLKTTGSEDREKSDKDIKDTVNTPKEKIKSSQVIQATIGYNVDTNG